jgi:uncharacterized protein
MQYRRFGKLDFVPSALGFGCMRFPILDGDRTHVDEPEVFKMLHYAIDNGVNYLDSAYGYHGGMSERVVGRALKGGYRQKVKLATKMPTWLVKEPADFDRFLNEQLDKLQDDHIDFYLLHNLNRKVWDNLLSMGITEWAEKAMADGKFGHFGFSFHDNHEAFRHVIDTYDGWTLCQVQYNYMDVDNQAGIEGVQYAASKGLAVIVMEPLLGGKLAAPPDAVKQVWDNAPVVRSPAEWALNWVWNQPEVSLVLSGMSSMQQVVENVASASKSAPNALSEADMAVIAAAREKYNELCPVPCTNCKYCMPCPNGVDIPNNFATFNVAAMYDQLEASRNRYAKEIAEAARASACIGCRQCEDKCPQRIPISEWLPYVHQVLGEGADYDAAQCKLFASGLSR